MFHQSCTTGLEAYFLDVPRIAYHPNYNPIYDNHLSTLIGPIAKDKQNFLDLMQLSITGNPLPRDDIDWLNKYLMHPDTKLASDRIIDALDNLDWQKECLFSIRRSPFNTAYSIRRYIYLCARAFKRDLTGNIPPPPVGTQKWTSMTAEDVKSEIEKFHNATNRFHNISVKKLTGQVFCLQT